MIRTHTFCVHWHELSNEKAPFLEKWLQAGKFPGIQTIAESLNHESAPRMLAPCLWM
jgi:hypothetical protein